MVGRQRIYIHGDCEKLEKDCSRSPVRLPEGRLKDCGYSFNCKGMEEDRGIWLHRDLFLLCDSKQNHALDQKRTRKEIIMCHITRHRTLKIAIKI
jgi:hypothetical protein